MTSLSLSTAPPSPSTDDPRPHPEAGPTLALVEAALWRLFARLGSRPERAWVVSFLALVERYGDTRERAGAASQSTVPASPVLAIEPAVEAVSEGESRPLTAQARADEAEVLRWQGRKRCSRCGRVQFLDEFHRDASKVSDRRRASCKRCSKVQQARRYGQRVAQREAAGDGQAS